MLNVLYSADVGETKTVQHSQGNQQGQKITSWGNEYVNIHTVANIYL